MGTSERRKQQRQKRKAAKEARMRRDNPEGESVYALKRRGVYPRNSPYVTGDWGKRMRKLEGYPGSPSPPPGDHAGPMPGDVRHEVDRAVRALDWSHHEGLQAAYRWRQAIKREGGGRG